MAAPIVGPAIKSITPPLIELDYHAQHAVELLQELNVDLAAIEIPAIVTPVMSNGMRMTTGTLSAEALQDVLGGIKDRVVSLLSAIQNQGTDEIGGWEGLSPPLMSGDI